MMELSKHQSCLGLAVCCVEPTYYAPRSFKCAGLGFSLWRLGISGSMRGAGCVGQEERISALFRSFAEIVRPDTDYNGHRP